MNKFASDILNRVSEKLIKLASGEPETQEELQSFVDKNKSLAGVKSPIVAMPPFSDFKNNAAAGSYKGTPSIAVGSKDIESSPHAKALKAPSELASFVRDSAGTLASLKGSPTMSTERAGERFARELKDRAGSAMKEINTSYKYDPRFSSPETIFHELSHLNDQENDDGQESKLDKAIQAAYPPFVSGDAVTSKRLAEETRANAKGIAHSIMSNPSRYLNPENILEAANSTYKSQASYLNGFMRTMTDPEVHSKMRFFNLPAQNALGEWQ